MNVFVTNAVDIDTSHYTREDIHGYATIPGTVFSTLTAAVDDIMREIKQRVDEYNADMKRPEDHLMIPSVEWKSTLDQQIGTFHYTAEVEELDTIYSISERVVHDKPLEV